MPRTKKAQARPKATATSGVLPGVLLQTGVKTTFKQSRRKVAEMQLDVLPSIGDQVKLPKLPAARVGNVQHRYGKSGLLRVEVTLAPAK